MNTDISTTDPIDPQKLKKWEELGHKVNVQIIGNSGKLSTGEVFIRKWSQGDRARRSVIWGAIFWGMALFCVLIPILHFILVPLFFILGPIVAYKVYQQESVVLGGFGTCPRCQEKLPIEKAKESWPLSDLCTHCHNAVKIQISSN